MGLPHIHDMADVYQLIGSGVVGYLINSVVGWFKHSFWVGFKAGMQATATKGGPLSDEERTALYKQVHAELTAEYAKKIQHFVAIVD